MSESEPPVDNASNAGPDRIVEAVPGPQTIEKLSQGLIDTYQPPLDRIRKQLLELTKKQDRLVEQLEGENAQFQTLVTETDLHEMMAAVKGCLSKLSDIKKDMTGITDRTSRLKRRALRLQQAKQKEALERTQEREERLLREQKLIADPAWLLSRSTEASSRSPSKEPLASPSEAAEETLGDAPAAAAAAAAAAPAPAAPAPAAPAAARP